MRPVVERDHRIGDVGERGCECDRLRTGQVADDDHAGGILRRGDDLTHAESAAIGLVHRRRVYRRDAAAERRLRQRLHERRYHERLPACVTRRPVLQQRRGRLVALPRGAALAVGRAATGDRERLRLGANVPAIGLLQLERVALDDLLLVAAAAGDRTERGQNQCGRGKLRKACACLSPREHLSPPVGALCAVESVVVTPVAAVVVEIVLHRCRG